MKRTVVFALLFCLLAACRHAPRRVVNPVTPLLTNNYGQQPMRLWSDSSFQRKALRVKRYRERRMWLTYFQDSICGLSVAFYDQVHHMKPADTQYRNPAPNHFKQVARYVLDYETVLVIHNEVYAIRLNKFDEDPCELFPRTLGAFRHNGHYYLLLEMSYFYTWGDNFGAFNTYQLVVELDRNGHIARRMECQSKWGLALEQLKTALDEST